MNRFDAQSLMNAALDGELTPDERETLDALVMDDPALEEAFETLKRQAQQLRELPRLSAPGGLRTAVHQGLSAAGGAVPRMDLLLPHRPGRSQWLSAAAVALIFVIGALLVMVLDAPPTPTAQREIATPATVTVVRLEREAPRPSPRDIGAVSTTTGIADTTLPAKDAGSWSEEPARAARDRAATPLEAAVLDADAPASTPAPASHREQVAGKSAQVREGERDGARAKDGYLPGQQHQGLDAEKSGAGGGEVRDEVTAAPVAEELQAELERWKTESKRQEPPPPRESGRVDAPRPPRADLRRRMESLLRQGLGSQDLGAAEAPLKEQSDGAEDKARLEAPDGSPNSQEPSQPPRFGDALPPSLNPQQVLEQLDRLLGNRPNAVPQAPPTTTKSAESSEAPPESGKEQSAVAQDGAPSAQATLRNLEDILKFAEDVFGPPPAAGGPAAGEAPGNGALAPSLPEDPNAQGRPLDSLERLRQLQDGFQQMWNDPERLRRLLAPPPPGEEPGAFPGFDERRGPRREHLRTLHVIDRNGEVSHAGAEPSAEDVARIAASLGISSTHRRGLIIMVFPQQQLPELVQALEDHGFSVTLEEPPAAEKADASTEETLVHLILKLVGPERPMTERPTETPGERAFRARGRAERGAAPAAPPPAQPAPSEARGEDY